MIDYLTIPSVLSATNQVSPMALCLNTATILLQILKTPAVHAVQAATAVGMVSIDVPGAGVTESEAVGSVVGKQATAATPVATAVPVVLVPAATPATTIPAVAVSGQQYCSSQLASQLLICIQSMQCHWLCLYRESRLHLVYPMMVGKGIWCDCVVRAAYTVLLSCFINISHLCTLTACDCFLCCK